MFPTESDKKLLECHESFTEFQKNPANVADIQIRYVHEFCRILGRGKANRFREVADFEGKGGLIEMLKPDILQFSKSKYYLLRSHGLQRLSLRPTDGLPHFNRSVSCIWI